MHNLNSSVGRKVSDCIFVTLMLGKFGILGTMAQLGMLGKDTTLQQVGVPLLYRNDKNAGLGSISIWGILLDCG